MKPFLLKIEIECRNKIKYVIESFVYFRNFESLTFQRTGKNQASTLLLPNQAYLLLKFLLLQ